MREVPFLFYISLRKQENKKKTRVRYLLNEKNKFNERFIENARQTINKLKIK